MGFPAETQFNYFDVATLFNSLDKYFVNASVCQALYWGLGIPRQASCFLPSRTC